jgi:hypothetical protein
MSWRSSRGVAALFENVSTGLGRQKLRGRQMANFDTSMERPRPGTEESWCAGGLLTF